MPADKPTLEAIRARLANATSVLAHLHYERDVRWLVDALAAVTGDRDSLLRHRDALAEANTRMAKELDEWRVEAKRALELTARTTLDLSTLSPREREVVGLLASGVRLSAIAERLGISQHTARNHLKHVFRKLGVHNQIELVAKVGGR